MSGEGKLSTRYDDEDLLYARVNATGDGVNLVVVGKVNKRIRVMSYVFVLSAAGEINVENDDASVLASFPFSANGGASYGGPVPAFETMAGSGLSIRNPAGVDTKGHISYKLV